MPCPLCGGTRAVVYAAQLDPRFLDYGAVWVFVLVAFGLATAAYALALVAAPARARAAREGFASISPRYKVGSVLAIAVVAWAWAIAHSASIVD